MKKLLSLIMIITMFCSLIQPINSVAASYIAGYEEDFDNLLNWKLSQSGAISLKDGAIVTSGQDVPSAYLKGDFVKWGKYVFTTEFSCSFTNQGNWMRIYLGGFSLLIRSGWISYLRDGETENRLGEFKVENDKHYLLKVERDDDVATVYVMATDDNRYKEIGTITGLSNDSNYGVSALNTVIKFYDFKFESKTKSPISFDNAFYNIAVGKSEKLNVISDNAVKEYTVDNTELAEIESDGTLTAKASGTVNVTVTDEKGNTSKTVVNCIVMADTIQLANKTLNLRVGESADLSATVLPSNTADKKLIFTTDDSSIVAIHGSSEKRRNIEAISPGTAKVKVTAEMGGAYAECVVNVTERYEKQERYANIKVDGMVQPLNKTIWGPNWEQLRLVSQTNDFVTERELEVFRDLKIKSSRGPGGTESNKWLPLEGTSHSSANSLYKRGKDLNGFYIEDLYTMPETLDIPQIVNLQITYNTIEDIKEIVKRIRAVTDKTILLELGNEYYDKGGMEYFATAQDYMDRCREVAKAVRSIDDNVKIGVIIIERAMEKRIVSDPNNQMKEGDNGVMWGETFIGRIYNWNSIVAQNADVYDAVMPHAYAELANTNGLTQEDMVNHLAASSKEIYEGLLYQSMQFPGKEIWVTEWGSLGGAIFTEKDLEERARMNFLKLPGQALHHIERLFDMVKTGTVTFAGYHSPMDSQGFGIVQSINGVYEKLPNYYTFKQAGEIIDRNEYFYDLDVSGGGSETRKLYFTQNFTQDVNNVVAYGFGDDDSIKEVLLINHTPDDMVVSIDNLKMKKTWEYGNGLEPFEGWGKKILQGSWTSLPITNPEPKVNFGDEFGDSVTLPPYSAVSVDVMGDMELINSARTLPTTTNAQQYKDQNTGDITESLMLEINNPIAYNNGQKLKIDVDNDNVVPQIFEDRTFVPIRFIAEAFLCSVEYENGVITIVNEGNDIKLTVGKTEAIMNGKPLTLNAAPFIAEDRTLVPIRAISEILAKQVYWINDGYIVISDSILDMENEENINKIKSIFKK